MGRTDGIHSVCLSLSVIDRRQRRSDWELINAESAEICIFNNVWRYSHWAVMSWPQCKQQPVGVILLWPSYHGTLPHTHTFPDKCQTLACLESVPPPPPPLHTLPLVLYFSALLNGCYTAVGFVYSGVWSTWPTALRQHVPQLVYACATLHPSVDTDAAVDSPSFF